MSVAGLVRRLGIEWLVGLGLIAGLTLCFGWLAEEVIEGDTAAFDRHVLLLFRQPGELQHLVGPAWLPETLRDLTSLGSTVVLGFVVLLVVTYLALARNWRAAAIVLAAVLGGQLLSSVLKLAFGRPRPTLIPNAPEVFTASFPSAHAMLSAVTYLTLGALLTRIDRRLATRRFYIVTAVILTVMVGISRVALGVHWPTDVLAGWCIGSAWAIGCALIADRIERGAGQRRPLE